MSLSAQVVSLQQQINKHTDDNKIKMTAEQWQQKQYDDAPAWMKEPPTDPKEKRIEGNNEYMWCPYHKVWQSHRPSECRINPANRNRPTMY
jgi:hypothetical protein